MNECAETTATTAARCTMKEYAETTVTTAASFAMEEYAEKTATTAACFPLDQWIPLLAPGSAWIIDRRGECVNAKTPAPNFDEYDVDYAAPAVTWRGIAMDMEDT
eukprot:1949146-Heterocapsa_arctica.AAC.1